MKKIMWMCAVFCMMMVGGAFGKTVVVTPLLSDRNVLLADNQIGTVFQFRLSADDSVCVDALNLELSVVEGQTVDGDRFVKSILLFDDTGMLVSEQELYGEISGDFRLPICQTLLKGVPRTFTVIAQGGFAGGLRANTVRINFAFSWLETDAAVSMAHFPRADVTFGVYLGSVSNVTVQSINFANTTITGVGLRTLAAFRFSTTGETKTICNPTFELSSNLNVWGFKSVILVDAKGKRLATGVVFPMKTCSRLLVTFRCAISVPAGATMYKVIGEPGPFHGRFVVSARASEMFPVGNVTRIQTRAVSDTCLVPGPTMIRP